MIRVLIAAPSRLVAADLETIVRAHQGFQIVCTVTDLSATQAAADTAATDVLLASDSAKNGNESIRLLESAPPSRFPPAIVLTDQLHPMSNMMFFRGSVRAVLPRDASADEIIAAITAVAAGLVVYPYDSGRLEPGVEIDDRRASGPRDAALTARELQVLQMLAGGMDNKGIATKLSISAHTVKFHVTSILSKLGAASRTEAVAIGIRRGLILL
ncbi:MAG: response regulator transcription factor [Candidatus Eremiobacteraeota bacterium]|nr:response regulator transcription factor [Candidatus Eremiobacteraeota bacterium]MBC5828161.1 response regulator transcription factor [Candidatus Eremiobacteraeota bacterium]